MLILIFFFYTFFFYFTAIIAAILLSVLSKAVCFFCSKIKKLEKKNTKQQLTAFFLIYKREIYKTHTVLRCID